MLPTNTSDKVAMLMTKLFRVFADTFFAKRYGHRAVVLETVAGVPGMVAGMWQHLRSLRRMEPDKRGWIQTLLAEAENERMHLMIFMQIANPTFIERALVAFAQFVFWHFYFILYVFFPYTAHRMIGYFENEAVISYTQYLGQIDTQQVENPPAPQIAVDYYNLSSDATLRDVIIKVRADEEGHAHTNHEMANSLTKEATK